MAPTPKPPDQRVRRNKDQPQWTKLRADEDQEVPAWPLGTKPGVRALAYWTALWKSPMAAMFTALDQLPLARLAQLHSKALSGDLKAQAAAMALEDRYGISPKSRRSLQWEIEQGGGDASPNDQPVDDEVARRRDRRARLAS